MNMRYESLAYNDDGLMYLEWDFCGDRKGHMKIPYTMFPLSKKDMKILCNGMPESAAMEMADFFRGYLDHLDREYKHYDFDSTQAGKERADIEKEQKRFLAMMEFLSDNYNIDGTESAHEIVKAHKDTVYARKEHTKAEIVVEDGITFWKAGDMYSAYKVGKMVYIIDTLSGLALCAYKGNLRDAPSYVSDKHIEICRKVRNSEGYEKAIKEFREMIEAAGFDYPGYMPEFIRATTNTIANTGKEDAMQEKALADAPIEKSDCKPDHRYNKPFILYVFRDGKITPIRHAKTGQKSPTSRKVYITIPCKVKSRYRAKYKLFARRISGRWILQAGGSQQQTVSGKSPPNKSQVYEKIRMENRNGKLPPVTIDHGG